MSADNGRILNVSQSVPEKERRWIVLEHDEAGTRACPQRNIVQAYIEGPETVRVRVEEDAIAEMTIKSGDGQDRVEENMPIDVNAARFLLRGSDLQIAKRRHLREGWEIDYFAGPLNGLVMAEIEKPTGAELAAVELPPWITQGMEVTDRITNHHLAQLSRDLRDADYGGPISNLITTADIPGIVFTGGPGSGKSTGMDALQAEFPDLLQCVPETATIIIGKVGARPPFGDRLGMLRYQRTIYRVQIGFELVSRIQAKIEGRSTLLMDRGTVDSAAYMERGLDDLSRVTGNKTAKEYRRYHGVICLSVPPRDVYEAIKANNPARRETYDEAVEVDRRTRDAWKGHPNFRYVDNGTGWDDKLNRAREALAELVASAKR